MECNVMEIILYQPEMHFQLRHPNVKWIRIEGFGVVFTLVEDKKFVSPFLKYVVLTRLIILTQVAIVVNFSYCTSTDNSLPVFYFTN